MLEQQQGQLVSGLQKMYGRLQSAQAWLGPALSETDGQPLTHDILAALNLLEMKDDGSGEIQTFEEDCQKSQSGLLAEEFGYVQRKSPFSSDSDHSRQRRSRPPSNATHTVAKPQLFAENYYLSASPSPLLQGPVPGPQQSYSQTQPLPRQQTWPLLHDPQFYRAEWSISDMSSPEQVQRSKLAQQVPELQQSLPDVQGMLTNNQWHAFSMGYRGKVGALLFPLYQQQLSNEYDGSRQRMKDFAPGLDTMDVMFSKSIQVTA
ncbi:hypothetical protein LTR62_002369 [Meristemomyces frigidus]|uniref:Uncharacterized protein n=1 Tax=Meristemomyces frigidus TaxID=1508187 RepID=A0AAN7T8L3_9PEZI|nr:hypothetical protein LTR62_002369 [Meristemomyces frigidus]